METTSTEEPAVQGSASHPGGRQERSSLCQVSLSLSQHPQRFSCLVKDRPTECLAYSWRMLCCHVVCVAIGTETIWRTSFGRLPWRERVSVDS